MRHPVRPFITAYKNRSSKSQARSAKDQVGGRGLFDIAEPPPSPPQPSYDEAYQAALKAADMVFGRAIPKPPADSSAPKGAAQTPQAPAGRVLPSLLEQEDSLAIRLKESTSRKPGRKKRADAADAAPDGARKAAAPAHSAPRRDIAREKPAFVSDEPVSGAAPVAGVAPVVHEPRGEAEGSGRRKRRPIQSRWVLKAELKPGQAWKRRLGRWSR